MWIGSNKSSANKKATSIKNKKKDFIKKQVITEPFMKSQLKKTKNFCKVHLKIVRCCKIAKSSDKSIILNKRKTI